MRNLFLIFLLLFNTPAFTQTATDTFVSRQQLQKTEKNITLIQLDIDSLKTNTAKPKTAVAKTNISSIEWLLIFSPVWLFGFVLLWIRKKLNGFNLRDTLTENEFPKKTIPNPEYTIQNLTALAAANPTINTVIQTLIPPTIEVTASTEYPKSSSRYIAFITSTLTWIIALSFSCFFLYQYIKTSIAPEFGGFSSVLISLGIGVIPYAFNKVSAAIK